MTKQIQTYVNIRQTRCTSHLAYLFSRTDQPCNCSISGNSSATCNYSEKLDGIMTEAYNISCEPLFSVSLETFWTFYKICRDFQAHRIEFPFPASFLISFKSLRATKPSAKGLKVRWKCRPSRRDKGPPLRGRIILNINSLALASRP